LSTLLCGAVFSGPVHALTYEGEEAAALRCANMIAYTGVTLSRADMIGDDEKIIMLGVTVLILERHVSGTRAQKKAAMAQMRDRRTIDQTLEDYRKHAAQCLVQFPIN
jgi:hypothetical protein